MFLVNSRQRYFRCGPSCEGQALYRRYGRFFAEFLKDDSLVPLGLLALSTCVGFRYGAGWLNLEVFLGSVLKELATVKTVTRLFPWRVHIKVICGGFAYRTSSVKDAKPIRRSFYYPSSLHRTPFGGQEY